MFFENAKEAKKVAIHSSTGRGWLGDLAIGAAVLCVVVMMVVPLTPWLIDLLISLNLGISILVLSLSLFIMRPLGFTAFPTLLLVATLYRLALNVSSTRLILLHANAGRIIGGFGGYVVGDDILVGAVIFSILAMVLFLVITKGAERVAEVAARFSLDALPGMQLAIDSDLRAGAISVSEASLRRAELDQMSRYYGALDGAMKFIRGDALAGLIIIAVNIVGGLSVGMLRHHMSLGEAIDVYGRLTVGDGLVSMIPALLISTAAGLIVTRVGQEGADVRLGQQLVRQLGAEPRALGVASVLMLLFSFVPGLPAWPFWILMIALGGGAYIRYRSERTQELAAGEALAPGRDLPIAEAPVMVELGEDLYADLSDEARERGGWREIGRSLANDFRSELGFPIAYIPWAAGDESLGTREVRLRERGVPSLRVRIPPDAVLARSSAARLAQLNIEPLETSPLPGTWISRSEASLAASAGLEVLGALEGVILQTRVWLRKRAKRLLGIDETEVLVSNLAKSRPVLVRETVAKVIELPALTKLLGSLLDDGIGLDSLVDVLEALAMVPKTDDAEQLTAHVRATLAPVITARLLGNRDDLRVLLLDSDMESLLEESLVPTARGTRLALSSEVTEQVIEACLAASAEEPHPVLMVGAHLRRPLATLLAEPLPLLEVVAHGEVEPQIPLKITGRIEI